jgi:transposase
MVTEEGLPVGYEVFPGNMYEGDTFKYAIDKIKTRYKVKRAVIVADSGLISKANLELLEREKLYYILGARLKSLSKKWQEKILYIVHNKFNCCKARKIICKPSVNPVL